MKKLGYWGKHDVCVRCGQYIYNISIWLDPNRSNKTERPKEELPQAYLDILEKREWSVCDYTDDGRCLLGDIQESQSRTGSGSARRIQRSKVRRNHDGRPETGQRYARLMTICPKECPDRHPGCHDHCERYAENKATYQKMKQEYDGSVRNPYCRRWTHRAIVRSFKKKFR